MKALLVALASLAGALAVAGCTHGDNGTSEIPFRPFGADPAPVTGSEPTVGGNEAPGGGTDAPPGGNSLLEICNRACVHVDAVCPGAAGGVNCAVSCANSALSFPGCEDKFRAYIACIAVAPLYCAEGSAVAPACDSAGQALAACRPVPEGGG